MKKTILGKYLSTVLPIFVYVGIVLSPVGTQPFLRKLKLGAVAKILASVFIFTSATVASAAQVAWTDWTSQSQFTEVSGSLGIMSQEVILETREVLTMTKKHQKLLALADSGDLKKKQKKKLKKLERRYSNHENPVRPRRKRKF